MSVNDIFRDSDFSTIIDHFPVVKPDQVNSVLLLLLLVIIIQLIIILKRPVVVNVVVKKDNRFFLKTEPIEID